MELPAAERRAHRKPQDRFGAARLATVSSAESDLTPLSPAKNATEIIEEFPPLFGFRDFPTILVGSGRRGRALPPVLVETILCTEVDHGLRE
jgi:hypothetical protein